MTFISGSYSSSGLEEWSDYEPESDPSWGSLALDGGGGMYCLDLRWYEVCCLVSSSFPSNLESLSAISDLFERVGKYLVPLR